MPPRARLLETPLDSAGAIPEPTTWAMMLVGVGAMGMAMRRRQQDRVSFA